MWTAKFVNAITREASLQRLVCKESKSPERRKQNMVWLVKTDEIESSADRQTEGWETYKRRTLYFQIFFCLFFLLFFGSSRIPTVKWSSALWNLSGQCRQSKTKRTKSWDDKIKHTSNCLQTGHIDSVKWHNYVALTGFIFKATRFTGDARYFPKYPRHE